MIVLEGEKLIAEIEKQTKKIEQAYKDLGILEIKDRKVPFATIKKSFNKMAMKYHPDRNKGLNEKEEKILNQKFDKARKAYEILEKEENIGKNFKKLIRGNK
ncbi:MAG: DnaJ domain-containing protein [Oligoflexia bacterium]|nr:DnaJ domain-containing protein [Oligoflexia bacterium]